jgi:hypothetical protein
MKFNQDLKKERETSRTQNGSGLMYSQGSEEPSVHGVHEEEGGQLWRPKEWVMQGLLGDGVYFESKGSSL